MAIEDELSSDIAIALLTGKERDPERLNNLKEVVLKVHASLQKISAAARSDRASLKRDENNLRGLFGIREGRT